MASVYRLIRRSSSLEDETAPSAAAAKKRLKTTGDDFHLKKLTYYGDKIQTNDEVHQSIELCPVMKALVDTEVFQRLRHIKQLGTSEYLYDCANGNRFQHSLGVATLAEKMTKTIKEEQPLLGATDKDVLCVKLAGLLHDIGHGPYSHLYEGFRSDLQDHLDAHPELKEHYSDCKHLVVPTKWSHEQSSLLMIDTALTELGLQINLQRLDEPLEQIGDGVDTESMRVFKPQGLQDGVLTSRDFVFIKECILGKPLKEVKDELGISAFIGRQEHQKEWLYDIVNNRHSGLDVDKLDYFARDALRCFGVGSLDNKLIDDARVAKVPCSDRRHCQRCEAEDGMHFMICYPLKHVSASMQFFKRRLYLHTVIYQHKKTVAVGSMLEDILSLADPFLRLQSYEGERFPISRAVLKSEFLVRLDDSVFTLIEHSIQPELAEARELCRRFKAGKFYKCAVDEPLDLDGDKGSAGGPLFLNDEDEKVAVNSRRDMLVSGMQEKDIHAGILGIKNSYETPSQESSFSLEPGDFFVKKYYMHHGRGDKNPLLCMRFFDSLNDKIVGPLESLPEAKAIQEHQYRHIIPSSLLKTGVRIFCRDPSKRDIVAQFFHQWLQSIGSEAASSEGLRPTPTPKLQMDDVDSDSGDDDEMEDNSGYHNAIPLSQESFDDEDHYKASVNFDDQSPIPTNRKRRFK